MGANYTKITIFMHKKIGEILKVQKNYWMLSNCLVKLCLPAVTNTKMTYFVIMPRKKPNYSQIWNPNMFRLGIASLCLVVIWILNAIQNLDKMSEIWTNSFENRTFSSQMFRFRMVSKIQAMTCLIFRYPQCIKFLISILFGRLFPAPKANCLFTFFWWVMLRKKSILRTSYNNRCWEIPSFLFWNKKVLRYR